MSRRSRKRRAAGAGNRWFGKAAVAALVLLVLAAGAGWLSLRSYLKSDAFRRFLAAQVARTTDVRGDFAPFRWDGLAVDSSSFSGTGDKLLQAVQAEGLHTEIGFGGVTRGVWEIQDSSIRRLEVVLDARERPAVATPPRKSAPAAEKEPPWYPHRAEVSGVDIGELTVRGTLRQGPAEARGMAVSARRRGRAGDYQAEIAGGTIRLPHDFLPELRLDGARLRYSDRHLFLTRARFAAWETGHAVCNGEWDMDSRRFDLGGDFSGLRCDELVSESWARRIAGKAEGSFTVGNAAGPVTAQGTLVVRDGSLTALPVLDALAAYADTRRFRVLTLSEARSDWRWQKGEITLSRLVLASEGLVRLEGALTIRGEELDGIFRLGLAPGTLANVPGAETDVFAPGPLGLLWTSLRITGTLDEPEEDLTERLVQAAGARMFDRIPETGERVLKFTGRVIRESPDEVVRRGTKVIDEGTRILDKGAREVRGILDDLLGPEPETSPEP